MSDPLPDVPYDIAAIPVFYDVLYWIAVCVLALSIICVWLCYRRTRTRFIAPVRTSSEERFLSSVHTLLGRDTIAQRDVALLLSQLRRLPTLCSPETVAPLEEVVYGSVFSDAAARERLQLLLRRCRRESP